MQVMLIWESNKKEVVMQDEYEYLNKTNLKIEIHFIYHESYYVNRSISCVVT